MNPPQDNLKKERINLKSIVEESLGLPKGSLKIKKQILEVERSIKMNPPQDKLETKE